MICMQIRSKIMKKNLEIILLIEINLHLIPASFVRFEDVAWESAELTQCDSAAIFFVDSMQFCLANKNMKYIIVEKKKMQISSVCSADNYVAWWKIPKGTVSNDLLTYGISNGLMYTMSSMCHKYYQIYMN